MSQPEPSPPDAASRRFSWRRLLQYRLRTLLIATTIVAAWMAWWSHTARRQRTAVAALQSFHGNIRYDFQFGEPLPRHPPYWPEWLVDALGRDYFANVKGLTLAESHVADGDLRHLKSFPELWVLDLSKTGISDAGLVHLKGLTALKRLYLEDTEVTDAGLEHLRNLTGLDELHFAGTQVTSAGVARLRQALPNCSINR